MIDISKATISNLFFEQFRNLTLKSSRSIRGGVNDYWKGKNPYPGNSQVRDAGVCVLLEVY